jgi:hypothetical protein
LVLALSGVVRTIGQILGVSWDCML